MDDNDIVIVAAKRTPQGNMLGSLSSLTASQLGAISNQAALESCGLDGGQVDEVLLGCVLQAGQGQAPARQASIKAGIPDTIPCTTVNKMCGSGLKTVMLGHDLIKAGTINTALCGGIESMSNAPYLLTKGRQGYRLGHGQAFDHMFLDGLEDAYEPGKLMGVFAEATAEKYQFSREAQDSFAVSSMEKAIKAQQSGAFQSEMVTVTVPHKKGDITVDCDENPSESKIAKIGKLKPAFSKTGTVTAANSSSISDGAASLILMRASQAKRQGITPLARICAHQSAAHAPEWFTTAPVQAVKQLLEVTNWQSDEVSWYEINEAFAVVTMAAIHDLKLDPSKVNPLGGACALGHPIGASGARLLVTLLHGLNSGEKGIAALCIGGGEAVAMAIEKL